MSLKNKPNTNWMSLYWVVTIILTFMICDGMLGAYLHWIEKPHELEIIKGLPGTETLPVAHPYKSYMNKPGTHLWKQDSKSIFQNGENSFDFGVLEDGTIINEFGHQVLPRDRDITSRPKQINECRILFLGGSTTFQPWPHLLVQLLNRRDNRRNYIAINAGTGGYTSQENMVDLVTSGLSYNLDMVIAYLPVNDIYWAAYYPNFKRDYTHMRIPLKIVAENSIEKPQLALRSYPFIFKCYDWFFYVRKMEGYKQTIDIKTYTTTGTIQNGTMLMSKMNFNKTVNAVIENIRSMKELCEGRNIKFVLLTQKLFPTTNPYYNFMDPYVLSAVEILKGSSQLTGGALIEMQKEIPNDWSDKLIDKVKADFPGTNLKFDQGLAYDSMHFSPVGLRLFAGIVADELEKRKLIAPN